MTDLWTGNKGEWSEAYVLLKLLCYPLIVAGGPKLEPIAGKYYVAKRISLNSASGSVQLEPLAETIRVTEADPGISLDNAREMLPRFLSAIKNGKGAFEIPEAAQALRAIGLSTIKASSKNKVDIQLRLPSLGGGQDLELGFSIKSQLGQASTLLNSSGVTNLEYTLVGGNLDELEIRGKKYHETRQLLRERNIRLQYTGTKSSTFLDNLEFFGADFPSKLGALVESAFMESSTSPLLTENVDLWAANHGGQLAGLKLRYQLKSLLRAVALGMKPGSAWVGDLEGYGGFIVVREDGELVCLHLENDDDFKTYLLNNSRFDFPKDELFAKPFMRDGKLIFSINFQVRFVK